MSHSTVAAGLRQRVTDDPGSHLVACGGAWRSTGDVAQRAQALAAGLFDLGVRAGDRVSGMMPNRDEAVDVFFACALLGAIFVPLNVFLKGEFLAYQLAQAEPRVVIADQAGLPLVAGVVSSRLPGCLVVALDPGETALSFAELLRVGATPAWPDPGPDDIACVLYTSGTTGMPKGCMISNGYLMHMPTAHLMHEWFLPGDTSLCPLPLYHGAAISALMDALVGGCRVCFEPEFRASAVIERAREIGATQAFGVGTMAAAMLASPPRADDRDHGLQRSVWFPLAAEQQERFRARFGTRVMCEGYGQTEVLPATMNGSRFPPNARGAGRALPWLDVAIVDDHDRLCEADQAGEIVVRPREPHSIFSGYWRDDQATLQTWRNLWHHTGDLGRLDAEGTLYFVDRKKDALRRRGENVSSVELEAALRAHPAIAQVAIHAVPSELGEDEIKACIVLEPGAELGMGALFEFCREGLPYYAVPRYVEFVRELPMNVLGRVLKHKLRATWRTPGTVDLTVLGLVVDRAQRR